MHLQHGDLLRIFRRWKSYESEFGDDEEHHRFLLIREVTMTLLPEGEFEEKGKKKKEQGSCLANSEFTYSLFYGQIKNKY